MKIWRCPYTREIIVGSETGGGFALFGHYMPFFGYKMIPCKRDGSVDNSWPPHFVSMKIGIMWLGHGLFYTPPWPVTVKRTITAD